MRFKLATSDPEEDLGVYGHELPQCSGISPAPMPQEVIEWEKAGKPTSRESKTPGKSLVAALPKAPVKRRTAEAEAAPAFPALAASAHAKKKAKVLKPDDTGKTKSPEKEELPHCGYSLIQKGVNKWFLHHNDLKLKVALDDFGKNTKYILYKDPKGKEVVWAQCADAKPAYCREVMERYCATRKSTIKSSAASASAVKPLRGMSAGFAAAPEIPSPPPSPPPTRSYLAVGASLFTYPMRQKTNHTDWWDRLFFIVLTTGTGYGSISKKKRIWKDVCNETGY